MVVPYRNPWECLMAKQKIQICPVGCQSLPIIVERKDRPVWKGYTANWRAIAVFAVLVLVYIVPKMKHIIHRIFACRVPECIEESKRKIAARIYSQTDLRD